MFFKGLTKEQWEKIRVKGKKQYVLHSIKEFIIIFLAITIWGILGDKQWWGRYILLPGMLLILMVLILLGWLATYTWNNYEKKYSNK